MSATPTMKRAVPAARTTSRGVKIAFLDKEYEDASLRDLFLHRREALLVDVELVDGELGFDVHRVPPSVVLVLRAMARFAIAESASFVNSSFTPSSSKST